MGVDLGVFAGAEHPLKPPDIPSPGPGLFGKVLGLLEHDGRVHVRPRVLRKVGVCGLWLPALERFDPLPEPVRHVLIAVPDRTAEHALQRLDVRALPDAAQVLGVSRLDRVRDVAERLGHLLFRSGLGLDAIGDASTPRCVGQAVAPERLVRPLVHRIGQRPEPLRRSLLALGAGFLHLFRPRHALVLDLGERLGVFLGLEVESVRGRTPLGVCRPVPAEFASRLRQFLERVGRNPPGEFDDVQRRPGLGVLALDHLEPDFAGVHPIDPGGGFLLLLAPALGLLCPHGIPLGPLLGSQGLLTLALDERQKLGVRLGVGQGLVARRSLGFLVLDVLGDPFVGDAHHRLVQRLSAHWIIEGTERQRILDVEVIEDAVVHRVYGVFLGAAEERPGHLLQFREFPVVQFGLDLLLGVQDTLVGVLPRRGSHVATLKPLCDAVDLAQADWVARRRVSLLFGLGIVVIFFPPRFGKRDGFLAGLDDPALLSAALVNPSGVPSVFVVAVDVILADGGWGVC